MAREQDIEKVLRKYPVGDVWGIGRKSVAKLADLGVQTAWDFTRLSEGLVRSVFGLPGLRTWRELRGESCVELDGRDEGRQSICVSRSFSHEITDCAELSEQVATFAAKAVEKLRAQHSACVEMVVFAATNRFREDEPQTALSRAILFDVATSDHRKIISSAVHSLRDIFRNGYGYKKAGVIITKLIPESGVVHSLFEDGRVREKEVKLSSMLDNIKHSFGRDAVRFASQGSGKVASAHERQSPHYTTLWSDIPTVKIE
jgi:DNA polymerase V